MKRKTTKTRVVDNFRPCLKNVSVTLIPPFNYNDHMQRTHMQD